MTEHATEHDADRHRFVRRLPEGEAFVAYEPLGGRTLDLQHTIVPPEARGHGIGEALVGDVFRWLREHDYRAVPTCHFVQAWLDDHPDGRALVVDPTGRAVGG